MKNLHFSYKITNFMPKNQLYYLNSTSFVTVCTINPLVR